MKRYTKPIHLQELKPHRRADSSLALINVVFLLLLFLLVSGTLRPPLPETYLRHLAIWSPRARA